ncbi:Aldo-keto reductase yakc [Naviculisporaceae sp. PSN 640]
MAPPTTLPTRALGKTGRQITSVGFGMMGLSIAYGPVSTDEERLAVLDRAWELGCTNWDSANVYGDNEDLIGRWFKLHPERRNDIFLATKFGIIFEMGEDGAPKFGTNTSAAYVKESCERSLQRLGIDSIDLYYVHRVNPQTPIEETMTALKELKSEGKIKAIGISECSSATLRRAYKIAPVDAVQFEYNPWQLDIESHSEPTNILATARELGITVFAYSPLGRGFLTGQIRSPDDFAPDDFRRELTRFSPENFDKNLELVDKFQELAKKKGCTAGQLALAWLLAQGDDIIPIPGTKKIKYLEENVAAVHIRLSEQEIKEIRSSIGEAEVLGDRNPASFIASYADTVEP